MKEIELELYFDEITEMIDFQNKKYNFLCIGGLFVPVKEKNNLLRALLNNRCLFDPQQPWVWNHSECPLNKTCKYEWHESNNCEIHHQEIKKTGATKAKIKIASRWLEYLIAHNKAGKSQIYFNVLYIDMNKLDLKSFGNEKTDENIYNRFFRSVISCAVKSFFADYKVTITKVYHDKSPLKDHKYFPDLNLIKLDDLNIPNLTIIDKKIHFIDSDHKKEVLTKESNLVQFIDLIIGSINQNIFYLSNDEIRKKLAYIIRPLVERMIKSPRNKKSSYNYAYKQYVSFFPKSRLNKKMIKVLDGTKLAKLDLNSEYYQPKKLKMPPFIPDADTLNKWC